MKYLRFTSLSLVLLAIVALSADVSAQTRRPRTKAKTTAASNISDNEISRGLKEALSKGVGFAVDNLGRENGFLDNAQVKIPLPKSLKNVEKALRFAGQGQRVDDFVETMNHAAEKAVPVAFDIFVDSIRQMSFNDARQILLSGQDDAATQFFRRTSEDRLREKFRPIVEEFTAETGVTQSYKQMMDKAGFMAAFIGNDAKDLDGYITEKALDGLFYMVAQEEKKIRRDPIGRTTSILQKVFGILR